MKAGKDLKRTKSHLEFVQVTGMRKELKIIKYGKFW